MIRYSEARILRIGLNADGFACEIVAEAAGSRGELRKIEMRAPGTNGKVIDRDVRLKIRDRDDDELKLDEEHPGDKLRNFNLDYFRQSVLGPGVSLHVNFTLRDPDGFTYRVNAECHIR